MRKWSNKIADEEEEEEVEEKNMEMEKWIRMEIGLEYLANKQSKSN